MTWSTGSVSSSKIGTEIKGHGKIGITIYYYGKALEIALDVFNFHLLLQQSAEQSSLHGARANGGQWGLLDFEFRRVYHELMKWSLINYQSSLDVIYHLIAIFRHYALEEGS